MIISAEQTLQRIRDELSGLTWSKRITEWQKSTFGRATPQRAFERAKEEWDELEEALEQGDLAGASKEAIDVVICLAAFVGACGFDAATQVQEKMQINEFERRWISRGDGTGYHIKETEK